MPQRELFEVEPQRRGWAPTQPGRPRTDARYEHSSGWRTVDAAKRDLYHSYGVQP